MHRPIKNIETFTLIKHLTEELLLLHALVMILMMMWYQILSWILTPTLVLAGANCIILHRTGRECDVSPYSDDYSPVTGVPIVTATTIW